MKAYVSLCRVVVVYENLSKYGINEGFVLCVQFLMRYEDECLFFGDMFGYESAQPFKLGVSKWISTSKGYLVRPSIETVQTVFKFVKAYLKFLIISEVSYMLNTVCAIVAAHIVNINHYSPFLPKRYHLPTIKIRGGFPLPGCVSFTRNP